MGQFNKLGERHGIGRLYWTDASYYEGEFRRGKMEGRGRLIQIMFGLYEGEWKDSQAHGKGKLINPSRYNKVV